jgi:hypothetical protein
MHSVSAYLIGVPGLRILAPRDFGGHGPGGVGGRGPAGLGFQGGGNFGGQVPGGIDMPGPSGFSTQGPGNISGQGRGRIGDGMLSGAGSHVAGMVGQGTGGLNNGAGGLQ